MPSHWKMGRQKKKRERRKQYECDINCSLTFDVEYVCVCACERILNSCKIYCYIFWLARDQTRCKWNRKLLRRQRRWRRRFAVLFSVTMTIWRNRTRRNNKKKSSRKKSSYAICFPAIVFNLFSAYRKLNLLILFKRIQQSSIKISWCWVWWMCVEKGAVAPNVHEFRAEPSIGAGTMGAQNVMVKSVKN